MIDLGISEAFVSLFRERRWWVKLGLISALTFFITILSLVVELIKPEKGVLNAKTITSVEYTSAMLFSVTSLILIAILLISSLWYTYENIQAAIQKRQTKLIWEYSLSNNIKKIGKYFIVSMVYGLIGLILLIIFVGIPALIVFSLSFALFQGEPKDLYQLVPFLIVLLCCVFGIILFVVSLVFSLFTTPGYLRLIATNTFSEAFHFGSNWRIGKKYIWYFLGVSLLLVVLTGVISFVSSFFSIFGVSVSLINPVVGFIVQVIGQIPVSIATAYVSFFVYPKILGNLYRGIINKEEELKFLRS